MKVNIYFDKKNHSKMYSYDIVPPAVPTKENYAMAISEAMAVSNKNKKSRIHLDRYYNLIIKIINNSNIFLSNGLTTDTTQSAFSQAKLLNDKEKPFKRDNLMVNRVWRVGYSQNNRLVMDIDNHDTNNLNTVRVFYESLFGYKFIVVKTHKGYWLISETTYADKNRWLYDNCRILKPDLLFSEYSQYKEKLLSLDNKDHKTNSENIKQSGLYSGVGNFDIIFVFINLKRQICTLRVSKKRPDEVMELVK